LDKFPVELPFAWDQAMTQEVSLED
jgi:hypothetical protein